jgi:hypothetical protein
MNFDERIMHDHPESDNDDSTDLGDEPSLAGALEKAVEPLVRPISTERLDPDEVQEQRKSEDDDVREEPPLP